jgi:hypothetical protein
MTRYLTFPDHTKTLFSLNLDDYGDASSGYHTLEVRMTGSKMSIYFNGEDKYTDLNIEDTWPGLASSSQDLSAGTTSFCHSAFVYESYVTFNMYADLNDAGIDPGDGVRGHRRLRYWYTRDWNIREDPTISGVTAKSAMAGANRDFGNGSDELRVRSLRWLEGGSQLTVPRSTVVAGGGRLFSSVSQTEYQALSNEIELNSAVPIVSGVDYLQKAYFVDGSNYKLYNPSAEEKIADWSASSGELPGGNGSTGENGTGVYDYNPRASIIDTWLGRIIMSGKLDDPENWFMSAVGDPLDWDYLADADTGAVQGTSTSKFGELGSPITALIPGSGTTLFVAGRNNLHVITGDPLWDDSKQEAVSLDVGVVGQHAWCYGPNKSIYFMSENGLYLLRPNDFNLSQTDRLSAGKFDKTFGDVAFDSTNAFLAYDYNGHGVHIFLAPTSDRGSKTTHYYYDRRSNSFWPMEWAATFGPSAIHDFRSATPENRRIFMGGFDGHIRSFSDTAKTDDGQLINSHVWLGPITGGSMREAKLVELVSVMDEQSPDVNYEIYSADTVEGAKSGSPVYSSTWSAGLSDSRRLRVRGSAMFIKVYDNTENLPWVFERLTAVLALGGRSRKR